MARVKDARRILGFRTLFNLAGPLTNPAGARAQVMGVYSRDRIALVADAMQRLGIRHAFVVHGDSGRDSGGLDEISTLGKTDIATVNIGMPCDKATIRHFHPRDVDLPLARSEDLLGGDARDNAVILEGIFTGHDRGPRRDIVLLNASAALVASGMAANLNEGLTLGREAIQFGKLTELLNKLRAFPSIQR